MAYIKRCKLVSKVNMQMNPKLPGTYVNLLVDVIAKWGISSEQLLAGTGIPVQSLKAPFWYVDFNLFNFLLEKAGRLANEPAMSIYLAQEMKASCYGNVGVVANASQNLEEAIINLEQYIGLHCSIFKPKLRVIKDEAYLYFSQPLKHLRMNTQGMIFLVLGFAYILESLAQQHLNIQIEFQQVKPDFYKKLKNNSMIKCTFESKVDSLSFKAELLKLPLKTADKTIYRLIKAQCQQDTQKLSLKARDKCTITSKVKEIVYDEVDGFLSLKQVAEKLHTSERTLQRQLKEEKITFQLLVAEVRLVQAERLLQQKLSIEEISSRLGYADISHFSRAFKKWTNFTPKFYREAMLFKS